MSRESVILSSVALISQGTDAINEDERRLLSYSWITSLSWIHINVKSQSTATTSWKLPCSFFPHQISKFGHIVTFKDIIKKNSFISALNRNNTIQARKSWLEDIE